MSAMRDMSKAIRQELSVYGPTLKEIPTDVLREYVTIVGAFYGDMTSELNWRSARQVDDEREPAGRQEQEGQQDGH